MTALEKVIEARTLLRKAHDVLGDPPAAGWDATPEPSAPALPVDVLPPAPLDTSQQSVSRGPSEPFIKLDMSKAKKAALVSRRAPSLPTVTDVDGDSFKVPSCYVLIGVEEAIEHPPGSGQIWPATEHGGGTLVAPEWVLTAAHVVCSVDPDTGELTSNADALNISIAPSSRDEHTEQMTATEVYVHAYYDGGMSQYSADLALIRLPVPSQYEPMQRADIAKHTLQPGELVGSFGMGAKSEGGQIHDQIQYQRMRAMPYIRDHVVKLSKEKGNFEQGYSGGPTFDDDEQRLWAGVISRYSRDPLTGVREFCIVPAPRAISWSDAVQSAVA